MKTIKHITVLFLSLALFYSCSSDDDPTPVNEEEVITTMTITLTPVGGGTSVTLQTQDLDGDGPNAPVVSVIGDLEGGTTYNGSIILLNETETPADNITLEVEDEGYEHQFFYSLSNDAGTILYSDTDVDGNPIGITFTFEVEPVLTRISTTLTATLRHEPNKSAAGVSNGDITNAGGETDIVASFTVAIE